MLPQKRFFWCGGYPPIPIPGSFLLIYCKRIDIVFTKGTERIIDIQRFYFLKTTNLLLLVSLGRHTSLHRDATRIDSTSHTRLRRKIVSRDSGRLHPLHDSHGHWARYWPILHYVSTSHRPRHIIPRRYLIKLNNKKHPWWEGNDQDKSWFAYG